jgi:hypothetical protein
MSSQLNVGAFHMYLLNILRMRTHRLEGLLEKLVEPLNPSGRFPSFLRRYFNTTTKATRKSTRNGFGLAKIRMNSRTKN